MTRSAVVTTTVVLDDADARKKAASLSRFLKKVLTKAFDTSGAQDAKALASSLNKVANSSRKLADSVSMSAKAVGSFGQSISSEAGKVSSSVDKMGKRTKEAESEMTLALKGIEGAFLRVQAVSFFTREAIEALKKVFEFGKEGAAIEQTRISFENFSNEVAGLPNLLNDLSQAAQGTISDMDLMSSTLLLVAGTTPELARTMSEAIAGTGEFDTGLLEVARAANILNPTLGSVDFLLQSLTTGIKRNSIRWIDNTGILISTRIAHERQAEALGKATTALTEEEKKLAVLNETLRVGKLLVDQVGDSTSSLEDPFRRAEVAFEEFGNTVKVFLSEALLPVIEGFNEFVKISGDYGDAIDGVVEGNIALATSTELTKTEQIDALRVLAQQINQVGENEPLADILFGSDLSDARLKISRELAALATDGEETARLLKEVFGQIPAADIFSETFPEAGPFAKTILGPDIVDLAGEQAAERLFELVAAENAAAEAATNANAALQGLDVGLFRTVGSSQAAADAARKLLLAQIELRRGLEGVTDDIVNKQIDAYKDLADAQNELATSTGDDVEAAGERVNAVSADIADNYREMASIIFSETDKTTEGAIRFQESLGLIDSATADNIISVTQIRDAMEDLFVLVATDDSFADLRGDYDTLAAAAALLASGQVDLSQGMNVAAEEAIRQVTTNEELKQSLLAVGSATDKTLDNQKELADAIRKVAIEAIKGASDLTEYGTAILEAAESAGVTGEELVDLAVNSGLLSTAQGKAASNAFRFEQSLIEMTARVKDGTLSEEQMILRSIQLAKILGIDLTGAAKEAADAAAEMSAAFSSSFTSELTKASGAVGGFGGAAASTTDQMIELNKEFNGFFVSALTAEEATENWTLRLLELSSQSGISAESIAVLAAATGEFSEEEIKAALNAAQMETAITKIVAALEAGEVTADQAAAAVKGVQEQLAEGGEVDLQVLGIPDIEKQAEAAGRASSGAAEKTETWASKLVALSGEAGATVTSVALLALATGEFSEEAVKTALKTAIMEQAVRKVAEAFAAKNITAREAIDLIGDFEASLDEEFSLDFRTSGLEDGIGLIDELDGKISTLSGRPINIDVNVNLKGKGLPDAEDLEDLGDGAESSLGGASSGGGGDSSGDGRPTLHSGGVVPGSSGTEVPAMLLAGEGVVREKAMSPGVRSMVEMLNAGAPPGFSSAISQLVNGFSAATPSTTVNESNITMDNSTSTQITNNNFTGISGSQAVAPILEVNSL